MFLLSQERKDATTTDYAKYEAKHETKYETKHEKPVTNQSATSKQKSNIGGKLIGQDNSTCTESLFEPYTFGMPSFFEEQFRDVESQPHFSKTMLQKLTDNDCCDYDNNFMGNFNRDFCCIEDFSVPIENLIC